MERGHNDLLDAAYRDLAKAALRAELIFVVIVACVIAVFWSMP